MRVSNKNKQTLYYSYMGSEVPKYERNPDGTIKYIEVDGEQVPVETGDMEKQFITPIKFQANISFSGGETTAVEFGTDVSKYDATIIVPQNTLELSENAIIWYKSTIEWLDVDKTVPNAKKADYRVTKITPSLNTVKYLLERIQK